MLLKTGTSSPVVGFDCVEARAGHFELRREIEPGVSVSFTASGEGTVLDRAVAWVKDQASRKDGGAL